MDAKRVLKLLKDIEWQPNWIESPEDDFCPSCGLDYHARNCELAAVIKALEGGE